MMFVLYGLYIIAAGVFQVTALSLDEHCIMETFRAECEEPSVILMTRARYGLMQKSRCIQGNPSDLGCSVDVLPYMDQVCSGRKSCQFLVPQPDLYDSRCTHDLASASLLYLESEYTCVEVIQPPTLEECIDRNAIHLQNQEGYISGEIAQDSPKGFCPWIIQAHQGQSIEVSIIDFHPETDTNACIPKAYVFDNKSKENITVCDTTERNRHVYLSAGSSIQIQIASGHQQEAFLIHYKVVGCADLIVPDDSWYRRSGDTARVGCHKQNKTWILTCHNNRWDGVVGACDSYGGSDNTHDTPNEESSWAVSILGIPIEIVITAVAGLALILVVCIVALLVRSKCRQHPDQAIYNQSTVSSSGGYATTKPHTRSSWACTYKAGRQHQVDTHIWETPLPEPSPKPAGTIPRQTHDNPPIPAAMLDSMEYTMPVPSTHAYSADHNQTEYTQPVKVCDQQKLQLEQSSEPALPLNPRHSEVNYYYYDPSSEDQTEYMPPVTSHTGTGKAHNLTTSSVGNSGYASNGPAQQTRECDYRTLIRVEDDKN